MQRDKFGNTRMDQKDNNKQCKRADCSILDDYEDHICIGCKELVMQPIILMHCSHMMCDDCFGTPCQNVTHCPCWGNTGYFDWIGYKRLYRD